MIRQRLDILGSLTRIIPERRPSVFAPRHLGRILIVKLSSIGDVVHALPVATALKRTWPAVRIDWGIEDWTRPLIEGHPAIDRVIEFPGMARRSHPSGNWIGRFRAAMTELRRETYDVVLDLQGLARSAILVRAARTSVRLARAGQREGAHLVSSAVPLEPGQHAVDEYLQVARFLGATTTPVTFDLAVSSQAAASLANTLERAAVQDERIIVITPSASVSSKGWPAERWRTVARTLSACGRIIIAGTRESASAHAGIAAGLPGVLDVTGRTSLAELMALLDRAALLIAPDTGSIHIAAALGTPVVSLFGPTAPWRLLPYGQPESVIHHGEVCGVLCPAYCLSGRVCLTAITPEEVIVRARRILQR